MLIEETLAAFAQETGLGDLALADDEPLNLSLSEYEELVFERYPDGVLLHLDVHVRYDMPQVLASALQKLGAETTTPYALQVGMRETPEGPWLVIGTRTDERTFTLLWIEQATAYLEHWLDDLRRTYPESFEGPYR
jgi:type III secretion system chaperone SycN